MTAAAARLRELARYQKAAAPDESAWVMAHTDFDALADEVERLEAVRDAADAYVAWTMGEARETDGVSRYETLRDALAAAEGRAPQETDPNSERHEEET